MAALHEIARQYAEEIRDGIAWVIIWKTGRSWHAESVWLNQDSDTFELEDLSTAAEILEQDPNAVMVNGYYCGHFGENMTIAELEAGILWHYEGGCNLLKDSTAFPPEPIPRPENLPADMPWYGKETTEEPDPYIFDGYMSVEDYEKRQQLTQSGNSWTSSRSGSGSSGNTHERPWTLLWTPYYIEPTPTRNGGTYTNTHGNGEPGRNTSGCL